MSWSRRLGWALLVLALGGAPGCNNGNASQTGGDRAENTSGGEDEEGNGGSSGGRDLQAPEGSRPPNDDRELPDSDLEAEAGAGGSSGSNGGSSGTGGTSGTSTGSGQASGGPGSPQAGSGEPAEPSSPWGQPEGESGRPLPPRRPMSASARSQYQRGIQLAAQGNAAGATEAFQAALSADPNAYQAAYNLGVMADRAGQEGRAIQLYQQALRIQADYERAIEGIARIHLRRGNPSEAINFVRPLADQWQRNLHIQAVLGDVLVQANRPDEGIQAARRALRRDERFVPAMVVLVKANLRLGRNELAESILTQAIEISGTLAELHFLRGRMYQQQNQLTPALESYRRAIELEPGYTEARMALGLQQLASGNYQDALAQFQAAAQLAPTLPGVRLALGDAYRANQQWQEAKAEFDRVQEMDPRNAQVHFNLAMMYREAGGSFPGLNIIEAYQRAVTELNRYRELMGPNLRRNDPSQTYLEELARLIEREQRAAERERARLERERERAARQGAQPAPAEGQPAPSP
jgi:tetratricopeptide (TPR) repeat protein